MVPPRTVAVLAYPGVQSLDVVGPLQVFATANGEWTGAGHAPVYAVEVIGLEAGPVTVSAGFQIVANRSFRDITDTVAGTVDTLLVTGGAGVTAVRRDAALIAWLRAMSGRVRRLGSVCSGAFLLAEAGLLDGRQAVTHWLHCARLAAEFPRVQVEPDALHLVDGGIHTSAGVTAGMDLALALVEEDLGHAVALAVARHLVLFLKRPGGQSQFSAHLAAQAAQAAAGSPIGRIQDYILANLGRDLSIPTLAGRAAMSPRNFTRVFHRDTGDTPARFVEHARLDAARRRLEDSREPVERIAETCGFGTAETMRRAFLRHLGVAPQDYRTRFQGRQPAAARPLAPSFPPSPVPLPLPS